MTDRKHIPALDGIRCVAISLVVLAHAAGTRNFTGLEVALEPLGNLGVRIFFVLSGFLISTLLFSELDARGSISLKGFYTRRFFRIFPAYYSFLFVIALLSAGGFVALHDNDLLHAFSYTSDYYRERSWLVGHTWSLSVEEQFYLLWPLVIVLAGREGALRGAAAVVWPLP